MADLTRVTLATHYTGLTQRQQQEATFKQYSLHMPYLICHISYAISYGSLTFTAVFEIMISLPLRGRGIEFENYR